MTAATKSDQFNRKWMATTLCCVSLVVTGLSLENSIFSLSIAAALCIALLAYASSVCSSRIKTAKLLFLNAGLLAVIFVLLRVILNNVAFHFPPVFWPWLHRIFRAWWLSVCSRSSSPSLPQAFWRQKSLAT
jgi:hypothetical protein